jgi:hypothetical protein
MDRHKFASQSFSACTVVLAAFTVAAIAPSSAEAQSASYKKQFPLERSRWRTVPSVLSDLWSSSRKIP